MTHKERILAACRGEVPDCIPWVPRLDLWYNAHRQAGTLPAGFEDATLRQITDGLGVGYHAVVPDFLNVRGWAYTGSRRCPLPRCCTRLSGR